MDEFNETEQTEPVAAEAATAVSEGASEAPSTEGATAMSLPPGELSPSSLNHMSDEELFGQHLDNAPDFTGSFRALAEGEVVKGEIVRIDREGVLVDVGQKSEGLIRPQEMGRENPEEAPLAVGDTVDVMVMGGETSDGQLLLSKKRADFEKAWDHVIEAFNTDQVIQAMVTDRVKGGLTVDLGIRGFIPASHVGNGKIRNLEQFIGQALPLKVIEVDKERRKVVLSHRLATEGEREKQRETTLDTLTEGQVRTGAVRRITDYGAFVDLGGVDGLLHISEMSWSRIKHPSEVVKQGQDIQVMVLKVNKDQGRISLGMRQILPDPWTEAAQKFHPGEVVEGKISRLVQGGAFLALEGGIEGFIKNSELAQRRIARPEDIVKVGDPLEVKVLDVRPDERRIELSRKAVEKKEERDRDDRGVREYRQRQPEDRFTLGDILGEALAERRATEGESEEDTDETESTAHQAVSEPGVESAPENQLSPEDEPNFLNAEEASEAFTGHGAVSEAGVESAPENQLSPEDEPNFLNAEEEAQAFTAEDAAPAAEAEPAPEAEAETPGEAGMPDTPVAEAHAEAVEPLSETEEHSVGEQPDIPA